VTEGKRQKERDSGKERKGGNKRREIESKKGEICMWRHRERKKERQNEWETTEEQKKRVVVQAC
jgi:hypothetical protein